MKQVTAILIGAGIRGTIAYASYALKHPEEFNVLAVAEPNEERRRAFAAAHNIPEELQFADYKELLAKDKFADCALVCTQDKMHFEPTMLALEKGYHVLCEKPMSPDKQEIIQMGNAAEKYKRILSICHVLRYSPLFRKIKSLLDAGAVGRIMNIQHIEKVAFWHHAHSYVRGNWRNSEQSSPMILAKCCHDLDILLWLVGANCTQIQSFGKLSYFTAENMPEGAPKHCLDGCKHRDECSYYAPKFYLERPIAVSDGFIYSVVEKNEPELVMEALKKGPYGRCVFQCDNNVVDHQVVNMEFANGVNATLTMSAFTNTCARELHIMGTEGELRANMDTNTITVQNFLDGATNTITLDAPKGGHGGSDERMIKDFIQNIAAETGTQTSAKMSVESHLMALAAEDSRLCGKVVHMAEFGN